MWETSKPRPSVLGCGQEDEARLLIGRQEGVRAQSMMYRMDVFRTLCSRPMRNWTFVRIKVGIDMGNMMYRTHVFRT